MTMPDQNPGERSAFVAAQERYEQGVPYYFTNGARHAFAAAWQAGRAYERQQAAAEITRLRDAVQKSIRSHENIAELRIIPDRYRDECYAIIEDLRAALAEVAAPEEQG